METSQKVDELYEIDGDEWISRAKEKFPHLDFSITKYINSKSPIRAICPEHGEFQFAQAGLFMRSPHGCPHHGRKSGWNTEKFIKIAKEKFPHLDYSKTEYKGNKTPLTVICPDHGEFETIPDGFLRTKLGCGTCGRENKQTTNIGVDEFLRRVKEIWGDQYDFSEVEWVNASTKVLVRCKKHNHKWMSRPDGLMGQSGPNRGPKGCPKCASEGNSVGETKIDSLLNDMEVKHKQQTQFKDCVGIFGRDDGKGDKCYQLKFDFYLPDINTFIEYDGEQHFDIHKSDRRGPSNQFLRKIYYDITKNMYAERKMKAKMIRIAYTDLNNLETELKRGLDSEEQLYLSTNYPKDMGWRDEELASVAREELKDLFENINRINSLII
jgi:hypothetical protein